MDDGQQESCVVLPSSESVDTPVATGTVEKSNVHLPKTGHLLTVKVVENVRVPSFSELEIMARVKDCVNSTNGCYLLESNLQNSDMLVARAVVTEGEFVPVRLLNPTGESIILYSGCSLAKLSEVNMVIDMSEVSDVAEDTVPVATVGGDECCIPLEEVLADLVKDTSLPDHQQDLLLMLLVDYSDVFARSKSELGRTNVLQHEIVTDGATPIRQRFRRLSPDRRAEMRKLLNDMLQKNVISPPKSPWAAPIVLVKKRDGTSRFCVDYRQINAVTRKDAYPLPRVDDILETLAGSQIFSTLDLASGYWQVEVKPEDREKTAFVTSEGLFEFNVLPFGLCNGPATFQRLMNILLTGIQWQDCLVYLDDIIVLGKTFENHLANLARIFQRLRDANLKLQMKKCVFGKNTVKFLGHVISPTGIATDPDKIAKVADWPVPLNKQELQQFLGFVNYYRRFVKDCASVSKPLYQLTEHNRPFKWTDQCRESFLTLRRALVTAPVLVFPDCSRVFILDTDASNQGIGAVLSQKLDDGLEHVVSYASRALSKAERRYSVTRKELLAVVTFLRHFRPYLLGRRFKLRTDHSSLLWLRSFKEPEGQLARWLEQLEEYDFEIIHRQGKLHGNADALSRLPQTAGECGMSSNSVVSTVATMALRPVYSFQDIRSKQLQDDLVGPFLRSKERNDQPPSASGGPRWRKMVQLYDQLCVKNGVLYRQVNNGSEHSSSIFQLVVPELQKEEVMYGIHEGIGGGHLGVEKSVAKLKERFYWPGHYTDVKKWCANCSSCLARKTAPPHPRAPLQPIRVTHPLEIVAVDIMGPFPVNENGNSYILVAEDYFTKWLEAWAIPNQEAKTVAQKLLEEMFLRFSLPDRLHSDQGRQFEGKLIEELCKLLQVEKSHTTPYHPQGDGLVERANRTILDMLATVVKNHKDWESHLRATCMAYNTSIQSTTGQSPFFLMFGRRARIPVDLLYRTGELGECVSVNSYVSKQSEILQEAYYQVQNRMGLQQDRQKEVYDRRRHGEPFKEGDRVMLYSPVVPRGRSKKLHCPWSGPFKVLKKLSEVTYRIRHCQGGRKRMVVHFNRLKLCPANMRSQLQSSQDGALNQVDDVVSHPERTENTGTGHKLLEQECGEGAYIVDIDEETAAEETTTEETMVDEPLDTTEQLVTNFNEDTLTAGQELITQEPSTRRYPSREHRPPHRFDDYVSL